MLQVNKKSTSRPLTAVKKPSSPGKFLVFAFNKDCPDGGIGDLLGMVESVEEGREMVAESGIFLGTGQIVYQIVNCKNMEIFETKEIYRLH